MATPQDLTTTVGGRRCTRSRARTAAASSTTSAAAEIVTPSDFSPSTSNPVVQQPLTSAAAPPPPPPPSSQPSASSAQAPEIAPSSQAAESSAIGTASPVSSSAPVNRVPPPPAAAAPVPDVVVSEAAVDTSAAPATPVASVASAARATTAQETTTSSNLIPVAATSIPVPSSSATDPTDPLQSSVLPLPDQSDPSSLSPSPSPLESSQVISASSLPTSAGASTGGSAGAVTPDQGTDSGTGLTLANGNSANTTGIVGGVVGGFAGIALISVLLFLCLRRRRSKEPFENWQKRISEKGEDGRGIVVKLKAIPAKFSGIGEQLKAVPAAVTVFIEKAKGRKSGPTQQPYNRQSARSSVSSVYSARSAGRSRSISEPPSRFREQLRGFGDRMPSLKKSRMLLQRRPDSSVVGSKSPFPGIVEEPVLRNSKDVNNNFADPAPLEPPRKLTLANPDLEADEGSPSLQQAISEGLKDQQRAPITPRAAVMSDRISQDPFASIFDDLDEGNRGGTPEWLRDASHKRTQSAATALGSHPISTYTASIYTTADNPFIDPADAPPIPQQTLPPNPPRRPSNAYNGLSAFNATSSIISRGSNASFYFGEPGPSRPTTNMFSAVPVIPRVGRQSDPFDLDRPEVLGFGNVTGRREVRASVTRQNSRSNRASSVPNWANANDEPYERISAVPGPLKKKPSLRR